MGSCWGADYTHFIVELQVILYKFIWYIYEVIQKEQFLRSVG